MGKKLQKEAMRLGLTDLPKYTFYAQPRKTKVKFSKTKPDFAYIVEDWMKSVDPSTAQDETGAGVNNTFYYMAPQIGVYVEIADKVGLFAFSPDKHVSKIDIYTNTEDHVRTIVKKINAIWDDGILPHLDFKRLENKYKVGREDIISGWNAFL